MTSSLIQQAMQLALFAVILGGPLPICLALGARVREESRPRSNAAALLGCLFGWLLVQSATGLMLVALGALRLNVLLAVEIGWFALGIVGWWLARTRTRSESTGPRTHSSWSSHELLVLGAIVAVAALQLWRLATAPITDFDSLNYHLATVATMYQTGGFEPVDHYNYARLAPTDLNRVTILYNGEVGRYPYSWEALSAMLVFPFGDDFLAALPSLGAWALLGLAICLASQYFGAERIHALTAAALALLTPLTLQSVNTMLVDLPLAAVFLAGCWIVLQFHRTRSMVFLALALADLGLLLSIKVSGFGYGLLLVLALLVLEIQGRARGRGMPRSGRPQQAHALVYLAAGAAYLCFAGGYWYIRNWVEIGNPLGLVQVQAANFVLFSGPLLPAVLSRGALANVFRPTALADWKVLLEQVGVYLGVPFAAMLIPACLLPLAMLGSRERRRLVPPFILLCLLAGTGLLYWNTPNGGSINELNWVFSGWMGFEMRFAIAFVGVVAILSAVISTRIGVRAEVSAAVVLILTGVAWAAGGLFENALYIVIAVLLLLGSRTLAALRAALAARLNARTARRVATAVAVPVVLALLIVSVYYVRAKREIARDAEFGGVQLFIEQHSVAGDSIGYLQSYQDYIYFGRHIDRRIVFAQPVQAERQAWIDSLRRQSVRLLAIGPAINGDIPTRELEWLNDPSGPFVRVFGDDITANALVYRLD